jgi:hypothetical protein
MKAEEGEKVSVNDILTSLEEALVKADKTLVENGFVIDTETRNGIGNLLLQIRLRRHNE